MVLLVLLSTFLDAADEDAEKNAYRSKCDEDQHGPEQYQTRWISPEILCALVDLCITVITHAVGAVYAIDALTCIRYPIVIFLLASRVSN